MSDLTQHSRTAARAHRARRAVLLAAVTVAASAVTAPAWAVVTAPHSVIVFPQRDFVSADGFFNNTVVFDVLRNGNLLATSDPVVAIDGLAEVNHPGGGCWVGSTPDILPGDVVQTRVGGAVTDATTTANVTATAATNPALGVIEVRGTATAPGGGRLPVDQIEQRMVANQLAFDLSGSRTLRADAVGGGNGILAYNVGTNWTATYTGLTPHDVAQALSAETRILWLGPNPAAVPTELTIFETSLDPVAGGFAGGPSPPCTAPAATSAMIRVGRALVNVANVGQPIVVDGVSTTGVGITPNITGVDVHVGGQPVHAAVLTAGTWTATIPAADLANLPQGAFDLTAHYVSTPAGTARPDETRALSKDTVVPPPPLVSPAAGRYDTAQAVTLGDAEAGATVFFTNNGLDPTPLGLRFTAPVPVTSTQTIKAIGVDAAGNASPVATFPFVIGIATPAIVPAIVPARPLAVVAPARALTRLTLSSRISRRGLRLRGLRLVMGVSRTAHVVRVRVYRAARNGRRTGSPLLTTFRVPLRVGTFRVTLRTRSLLARMRPGRYVVEVAAGDSRGDLQTAVTRRVTVTR